MKRFIIILALSILSIGITTAQQQEHFKFKGIPIDGPVSTFRSKLIADGFTEVKKGVFSGKFLRQNCMVSLVADDNNMIWRVAAVFPQSNTWSTIEAQFNSHVALYTEKYGKPTSISREFGTYTSDHPGLKMIAISNGECRYIAIWKTQYGEIDVRIVKGSGYDTGAVRVVYTDKANKNAVHQSDLDEI
jgi:hypothetical protein